MKRRRFTREFKLEAVRLIKDRGVSYVQAAEDLGVHQSPAQARGGQAQGRAGHPKKSRGLLREGIDVKFGFVAKHRRIWPAEWLCGALGVSRGGFYAWLTRPRSARARSDEELAAKVRASFLASDRTYGARRVWHDMLEEGVACGLHRIERLMRFQALRARPRRASAQLVTDALVMAIWRRGKPDALLHRSDRGSQYTSEQFQRLMADQGVVCSMSRSGNVWDNAAMESFFSSLKTERTARKTYRTRDEAKADVFDYIERFYNPKRRHSTIGYQSPVEFEKQMKLA